MKAGGKENQTQAAITAALEVYCSLDGNPQLWQFPPYANQQGEGMRKYCGDIIGLLDNAQILLLEVKELDCECNMLCEYDEEQHASYISFQDIGVPIAYAYNTVPLLECNKRTRNSDWPQTTLSQVNRSLPRGLPNHYPKVSSHHTLLDWLQNARGQASTDLFGMIHGVISLPSDLRNGILVLLYGVQEDVLAALTPEQVKTIVGFLQKNSSLKPDHHKILQKILGASANVFARFSPTTHAPDTPADSSNSFRF